VLEKGTISLDGGLDRVGIIQQNRRNKGVLKSGSSLKKQAEAIA
jgi:hypothetical protein